MSLVPTYPASRYSYSHAKSSYDDIISACIVHIHVVSSLVQTYPASRFVGSCLATSFYRQFAGYGKGLGHHKVGQ